MSEARRWMRHQNGASVGPSAEGLVNGSTIFRAAHFLLAGWAVPTCCSCASDDLALGSPSWYLPGRLGRSSASSLSRLPVGRSCASYLR